MVPLLPAQDLTDRDQAPITRALEALGDDVRVYNDHITTLSSPFMEGRLPGTNGMQVAKDYVEFWLRDAGVEGAFTGPEGGASFRQAFPLGSSIEVRGATLSAAGRSFKHGSDFSLMSLGSGGKAAGGLVFIGYSIAQGPEGYTSFTPGQDLSGKIAVMLRFEPMDENGRSRWSEGGPWTSQASFANKVDAAAKRGAEAILIINTPGANDPRNSQLTASGAGGNQVAQVPVLHLSTAAGTALVEASGMKLDDLRRHADEGGAPVALKGNAALVAGLERIPLIAENVGGWLPGKGALAGEVVVLGAHLDHLGMGNFGSRSPDAGKRLHPGADDNASGSAAVLMIADEMVQSYAALPADAAARSVLFLLFSGEESGLNGSQFYVANPVRPLKDHALMINFDMIGRIKNSRIGISGISTHPDLRALVEGAGAGGDLSLVLNDGVSGNSDHAPFHRRGMPVLFGASADGNADYHTPEDTSARINRVGGAKAAALFHQILLAVATHPRSWRGAETVAEAAPASGGPGLGDIKVRFGVAPGNYSDDDPGIVVASVTPGGSAAVGGILADDRMLTWNGRSILGIREWMGMMADHKPGDKVQVGLLRDGKPITLEVELQARNRDDG